MVCGTTDVRLVVDHDHLTGEVRGVLCVPHNAGLGSFHDNPVELVSAAGYLLGNRLSDRISWDNFFLIQAMAISLRGDCIRRKVGAVLVDQNHIIRGLGFNGSEPGGPSCFLGECPRCLNPDIPAYGSYEGCIERHAEDNCLRNTTFIDRHSAPYIHYLTMYVTCAPCMGCKDLLFDFGVDKVVWPEGHLDLIPKL